MKEFNTLDDFNLENKTVLLRVDFNMPLDKKSFDILDDTRIRRVLPTINELIKKNAKTVIMAHQGRKGSWDFIGLKKHAELLAKMIDKKIETVDDIFGYKAQEKIKNMQPGEVLFLDNVRKFEHETDKKTPEGHSQTDFIQNLYPLADLFVNDAFAAAHRSQCSIVGFTTVLPSCAGRLMEKELTTLGKIIKNPEKPSVFLFGGAKFSDVIKTIERLFENKTADRIILTGLPANAFLKAEDVELGSYNEEKLMEEGDASHFEQIKKLMKKHDKDIILPEDFAISVNNNREEITIKDLPTNNGLFDIGTQSIEKFKKELSMAKTIFLSGPCGVFEEEIFMKGTKEIFNFVAETDAFSIVGGGHTVAAVKQLGLEEKISHISTGGGSLEKFMMGEKLVAVEALKNSKTKKISLN